jgi:protoporphyrinogen oxidase
MRKQDRQGVRTPADVERKYNIGHFMDDQKKKDESQNQKIEQVDKSASTNIALLREDLTKLSNRTSKEIARIAKDIDNIRVSSSNSLASINLRIVELAETDKVQTEAIAELSSLVKTMDDSVVALRQIVSEITGQSGASMLVYAETESLNAETIYADKSFTEIDEAINTGSIVRVKLLCSDINDFVYLHLASHLPGVEVTLCGYFNGLPVTLQLQADDTSTS